MQLGLHLVDYHWPGGPARLGTTLAKIAQTAEACGFDSIALADHLWASPWMGGPEREMLESYATLAFLAAHTRRVKLLTIVTATPYRHPGVLAKTATTLDVLSGAAPPCSVQTGDRSAQSGCANRRFRLEEERKYACARTFMATSVNRPGSLPYSVPAHARLASAATLQ